LSELFHQRFLRHWERGPTTTLADPQFGDSFSDLAWLTQSSG